MKLLFFLRDVTDCGGIQQTTCLNVNALTKKGYQVQILSLYHTNKNCFFKLDETVSRKILFDRKVNQYKQFFEIRSRLKFFLQENDYDILIIQGTVFATFVPQNAWKTHKIIVCEHGYYYMGRKLGLHWFGKQTAMNKSNAIVTLTELDANNYRNHCKRSIPIVNIYNPCINQNNRHEIYDLASKVIVSCGTLDNIKRFDHAIEAAKNVFNKYPDWQWFIYGDGNQREYLQQLIVNYNLESNIFLKGYEKDKNIIYGNKAFLVLTSKFEGFGLVLVEAMQHHLPVVSYAVNYGPREIVNDGINGYLVSDGAITELSVIIEKLINDRETRKKLSEGAYNSLDRFSLDKITNQWIGLIESI